MIDQFRALLARLRAEDAAMATMPERVRHYHGAGLDGNRNARLLDLLEALVEEHDAAKRIRHWHNTGRNDEGMIVSSACVYALWRTTQQADAALRAFVEAEQQEAPRG